MTVEFWHGGKLQLAVLVPDAWGVCTSGGISGAANPPVRGTVDARGGGLAVLPAVRITSVDAAPRSRVGSPAEAETP